MNIIISFDNKTKFKHIDIGNVFKHRDSYFMKIEEVVDSDTYMEHRNAINLRSGCAIYFGDNEPVEPIDCDLVIK